MLTGATSIPGEITASSQGEGAEVSALISILNQIAEQNEILLAKISQLEQGYVAEVLELRKKTALLEFILAGRNGKIVVLETPQTVRPPTKEIGDQIAILARR